MPAIKDNIFFKGGHDLSFMPPVFCDSWGFPAKEDFEGWPRLRQGAKGCEEKSWAKETRQPRIEISLPIVGPSLFVDTSASHLLMGDITVLARFIRLLTSDVLDEHVPASRIEIRGSFDPEDDTSQVIVRLWIRELSNSEIRSYYSDFGGRVDAWMKRLTEEQRSYFVSNISFQARREADA